MPVSSEEISPLRLQIYVVAEQNRKGFKIKLQNRSNQIHTIDFKG